MVEGKGFELSDMLLFTKMRTFYMTSPRAAVKTRDSSIVCNAW